ncbi:MAG: hypothetical protein OEV64_07420 [Desulfobulbaceae bacterium]|nr:hypothetical protein [Desulfobulbaceae bacterium]
MAATISSADLCILTGLTDRRHRQLAQAGHFPPPVDGQYDANRTFQGLIKYAFKAIRKKSDELEKERTQLTKAKREMAQEELAKFRGEYIPLSVIGQSFANTSVRIKDVMVRRFEQELGPKLAGKNTIEILMEIRKAVDSVIKEMHDGLGQWMSDPLTVVVQDSKPENGAEE